MGEYTPEELNEVVKSLKRQGFTNPLIRELVDSATAEWEAELMGLVVAAPAE